MYFCYTYIQLININKFTTHTQTPQQTHKTQQHDNKHNTHQIKHTTHITLNKQTQKYATNTEDNKT